MEQRLEILKVPVAALDELAVIEIPRGLIYATLKRASSSKIGDVLSIQSATGLGSSQRRISVRKERVTPLSKGVRQPSLFDIAKSAGALLLKFCFEERAAIGAEGIHHAALRGEIGRTPIEIFIDPARLNVDYVLAVWVDVPLQISAGEFLTSAIEHRLISAGSGRRQPYSLPLVSTETRNSGARIKRLILTIS